MLLVGEVRYGIGLLYIKHTTGLNTTSGLLRTVYLATVLYFMSLFGFHCLPAVYHLLGKVMRLRKPYIPIGVYVSQRAHVLPFT